MRCFQALRSVSEIVDGVLPLQQGDIIIHMSSTDDGWSIGVCRGDVGFYLTADAVDTELPPDPQDVVLFTEVQRINDETQSSGPTGRRDSAASAVPCVLQLT